MTKAWPRTLENLEWHVTDSPMSGDSTEGSSGPYTVDPTTSARSHAGSAYYEPAAKRKSLAARTEVLVKKLAINKIESGELKAKGVHFFRRKGRRLVKARKEIVLAAGVFQTPQFLEFSEVGNPKTLKLHGLKVVMGNENIGQYLRDHAMTGLCAEVAEDVSTGDLR